jgi:hypothetical protein
MPADAHYFGLYQRIAQLSQRCHGIMATAFDCALDDSDEAYPDKLATEFRPKHPFPFGVSLKTVSFLSNSIRSV